MGNEIRPAIRKSCACFRKTPPTLEKKYNVPETNLLGQGTFAKVYQGTNRKTKLEVAVKVIDKKSSRRDLLNTEIWILQNFGDHPNIVNFYDMYETESEVQLVMELMPGGELFDLLDENGPYGEADAAKYLRAIACGLAYLHAGNVVHRDLKPENLLLTSKGPDGVLKITDFGLAKILIDEELMKVACGTWIYCAPEVLLLKHRRCGQYDINCDMFSVGCILYIIISGYHPFDFDGNDDEDLMQECILSDTWDFDDPAWDEVSDDAKDLIELMLRYDPQDRISAAELMIHPWTAGRVSYGRLSKNVDKDLKRTRASLRNNKLEGAEMVRKSLNVGAAAAPVIAVNAGTQDENPGQKEPLPEPSGLQRQFSPGRQPRRAAGTGGSKAIEVPITEVDAGTGGGGLLRPPRRRQSNQSNLSVRSCPQRRQAAALQQNCIREAPEGRFPKKRAGQPGVDGVAGRFGAPPDTASQQEMLQQVRAANSARWEKYDLKGATGGASKNDKAEVQPLADTGEICEAPSPKPRGIASTIGTETLVSTAGDRSVRADSTIQEAMSATHGGGGTGASSPTRLSQGDVTAMRGDSNGSLSRTSLTKEDAAAVRGDSNSSLSPSSVHREDRTAGTSVRSSSVKKEWGTKKKKIESISRPMPRQMQADLAEASNAKSKEPESRTAKSMTVDEWKAKRVPRLTNNANIDSEAPEAPVNQTAVGELSNSNEVNSIRELAATRKSSENRDSRRRSSRMKAANVAAAARSSGNRFNQRKKKGKAANDSQDAQA